VWRNAGWKWLLVLVGFGAVLYLGIRYHQRPTSSSSIEDWVKQQDFDPVRPFRSDFLPGTLLTVGKTRDRVAMASSVFLDSGQGAVSHASLPNVTLKLKLKAAANAEGNAGAIGGGEDLNASIELSNLELLTLPLNQVKDRVRANSRVGEALANHPDDLFVILEALEVGKMQLVFRDASEVRAKAKSISDWVKATFGSTANLDQSGTIQSDAPLILGTRLARLSEASTALGGSARETTVDKISTADLEKYRTRVASKVSRLYSNFDIFGLVISLGNYPSLSKRAGGELPDAVRTGEGVATDLRRLVSPSQANHIQVISSNEVSPKSFDPTRRLSKSDVLQGIHDFQEYVRQNSDPSKQTLIVFYYFGHGLADGMSKSVFLVPEQFVDDESKNISNISDRLIDIAEIDRQFSEVTDHSILLIDACRAYKDQAKQLIEAWKTTVRQGSDVSGILNAIQFASGIYGPTPIIFASDDGMAADTVKYPAAGLSSGTGPLALKLKSILDDLDSSGGGLALGGFVRAFQSGQVSLPNIEKQEALKVRGYSFTRADFIAKFGSSLVVSSEPVDVLRRDQAFVNPYFELHSHSGGKEPPIASPSGTVQVVRADRPSGNDIQELVFAPDVGLVALDDANNVWIRDAKGWRPFHRELPIMRIGWDRECGLLLFQLDERILYCFRDAQLRPAYENFHSELLGPSVTGGFVAVRSVGGGVSGLMFGQNGKVREIARIPASEIFSVARDSHSRYWFSTADGLWVYEKGKSKLNDTFWKPDNIVAIKDLIFIWSEDGRIVYKVNTENGVVEELDLRGVGFGDLYIRRDFGRTFAIANDTTFCFGFGPEVVEISLTKAHWRKSGVNLTLTANTTVGTRAAVLVYPQ
jgi:hypothetical protein